MAILRHKAEKADTKPTGHKDATPQEIAQAITHLEARQVGDAERADGTEAIRAIVHELGLNYTPEEIQAEIVSHRVSSHGRKRRNPTRLAIGALFLLSVGVIWKASHQGPAQFVRLAVPALLRVQEMTVHGPETLTLAEATDEQPVQVSISDDSNKIQVVPRYPNQVGWTLIKHEGRLYLRGWTLRASSQVVEHGNVTLFAHSAEGDSDAPVTLALDQTRFNPTGGGAEASSLSVADTHLDKHAWEKW